MNDWEINNCGIFYDIFEKVCAGDVADYSPGGDEDECTHNVDNYSSRRGICASGEYEIDCGDDGTWCVYEEDCVEYTINQAKEASGYECVASGRVDPSDVTKKIKTIRIDSE